MSATPEATLSATRFSWGSAAAAVVLALTVVRVLVLVFSDLNLHGDEAQYWSWAQDLAFGYVSKPPMVAWIIAATTAVCGDGEACVRLASPLIHAATSGVVYLLGRALFTDRIGFWVSVTYATLPAVSYSSGLISTDVPLLFFWSLGLYAFVRLSQSGSQSGHGRWAVLLGLALGLGMLSKYAMAYALLCGLVYASVSAEGRRAVFNRRVGGAVVLGLAIAAPNLWWNIENGWATVSHTAANANWSGPLFHPGKMLEFVGAQFGVFGPVLFVVLIWWLAARRPWRGSERERLLFSFAVPVLAIVVVQSLLSRAHANWAAVTYVAASVAVITWLARRHLWGVVRLSFALHLVVAAALYGLVVAFSGGGLPERYDAFARLRGWDTLGQEVAALMAERPDTVVLTDDRMIMAELLYYTRAQRLPIEIWSSGGPPHNQYELIAPFRPAIDRKILYITAEPDPDPVIGRFAVVHHLPSLTIPERPGRPRVFYLYDAEAELEDY